MLDNYFSDTQRGMILFIAGLILLLYVLGVFTVGLSYLLGLIAIIMIVLGFLQARLQERIKRLFNKKS